MRLLGTFEILPSTGENNYTLVRDRLSLGASIGTVVEEVQAGTVTKVALVGDATTTVSIVQTGTGTTASPFVITIHYDPDTSTVADVEAAIEADADTWIRIRTPSPDDSYTLVAGDAFTATELTGAESLDLLASMSGQYIEIFTNDSDVYYAVKPDAAVPSTFAIDDESGFPLAAGFSKTERIGYYGAPSVLALYNAGSGTATVQVFVRP